MPASHRTATRWRKVLLALVATLVSLSGAEELLRWLDVADPPAFEPNPEYGYLMRPNQWVHTHGDHFRINNVGLRGPDLAMPKPDGVFRLVFLGDSITYGWGSPDDDLFVNRLGMALASSEHRRIEVVNLAAPGWGIQNMAGFVESKGLFDADAVVWVVAAVDFRRRKSSMEDNRFVADKPWARLTYTVNRFGVVTSMILARAREATTGSRGPNTALLTLEQNAEAFRQTLARITEQGIPCAVIVVPFADGYQLGDLARFRSRAESLSVPFLALGPAFERHRSEKLFIDEFHLNVRGHAVIADEALGFLRQRVFHRTGPRRRVA